MSNQRNNTRALQQQMAKMLSKSEMWLVLRLDHEGKVHCHTPNEEHLALFGAFFKGMPEILEAVNEFVKQFPNESGI